MKLSDEDLIDAFQSFPLDVEVHDRDCRLSEKEQREIVTRWEQMIVGKATRRLCYLNSLPPLCLFTSAALLSPAPCPSSSLLEFASTYAILYDCHLFALPLAHSCPSGYTSGDTGSSNDLQSSGSDRRIGTPRDVFTVDEEAEREIRDRLEKGGNNFSHAVASFRLTELVQKVL